MSKHIPETNELKIGEYTYQNGHCCHVLYRGTKPTQANILLEASKEATIKHCYEALKKNEAL